MLFVLFVLLFLFGGRGLGKSPDFVLGTSRWFQRMRFAWAAFRLKFWTSLAHSNAA